MYSVKTAELKSRLSEHLRRVRAGETVTVLDRQTPIARIVPLSADPGDPGIRRARGSLADAPVPSPSQHGFDIVDELLRSRIERL